MSGAPTQSRNSNQKRTPFTVWELPKLLKSVHQYRKSTPKFCRERPHYKAILAFVHRNRMAIASQIQRRFAKYLPSDRTARRHLAEMETLGFLGVVETNNISPLWPKVYFVTGRGLARLKDALKDQGQEWRETRRDRRRSEGVSAQHVLHEVMTTEFLLLASEAAQENAYLEILTTQRRSLAKHDAFKLIVGGQPTRLQPDGMFLYRHKGKGMMVCFAELDLSSMSLKQMAQKFRRYQAWAKSSAGISYLKAHYGRYGATTPTANFRILMVVSGRSLSAEQRRVIQLIELAKALPNEIRDRIWLTTVKTIPTTGEPSRLFTDPIWHRPHDALNVPTGHRWRIVSLLDVGC